ncbi:MAG: helix-turn-helix transcriptional regulator [Clostridia bacterium]|nr:helix-turn-helix transcriptional regulator [Clostridia bacterium]
MDVLKKIEQLKEQKGWSIYKLSIEAGLTTSTLTNMFTRKTLPSITTLSAICDAFGITLAQFFAEDNNGEILSGEEKELIQSFRRLSSNNKEAVIGLCKKLN